MPTREQILELLWERPIEIAHWVGYDRMTDLHNDWLRQMLYGDDDYTLQAHRGSYKSTDLSVYFAIHAIIYPNQSLIYMRKTDANVADICRQTQNILMSGAIQQIVRIMYGHELVLTRSSTTEIDTCLHQGVGGQAQITGYGINASITGKHSDVVVTDDIVTIKDRVSRAEREHTRTVVQELRNIRNRGGRFINAGTPWHKDDAFELMEKRGKVEKYDCYSTGLISQAELREIRESMAPSLFAANYELRHIADENALFSEPVWLPVEETEQIYGGRSHIDASYGGEDYTAYTILTRQADGSYVGYGKLWRKHVDQCMDAIDELQEKYQAGTISCETNGDKGYLGRDLRARGHSVHTYHERQNKFLKISSILRKNWSKIRWIDETDPEYMTQILDYTEDSQHDDAPDSAASLLREFDNEPEFSTSSVLIGGF